MSEAKPTRHERRKALADAPQRLLRQEIRWLKHDRDRWRRKFEQMQGTVHQLLNDQQRTSWRIEMLFSEIERLKSENDQLQAGRTVVQFPLKRA